MRRLTTIVVIILVILAAVWSGGWYAAASWVEARVPGVLQQIADRGIDVDCPRRAVVGFPFALQVACGPTEVAERNSGSHAEMGGVTGGVSVFAPMTAAVALESPATIQLPLLPEGAEFTWNDASVGLGLGMNGPRAATFDATDFSAKILGASLSAGSARGTVSPANNGGTEGTAAFTALVFSNPDMTLPPLDGKVSGWISVPPEALASGRAGVQAPVTMRLYDTAINTGGSRIELEANVSIDAEGILDGTVTVRLAGTEGFQKLIESLPADQQERGNQAIGGMFLFGQPTTMNGQAASELTVNIVRGVVKVGPVEKTLPRIRI